jgi:putative glutamine amidotransferase
LPVPGIPGVFREVASVIVSIAVTQDAGLPPAAGPGGGRGAGPGPVIGISTSDEQARWRSWEAPALLLPRRYAEKVAAAGGVPVLLPPVPGIEHAVDRLDGLILSGGGDIDPALFGAQPHPETSVVTPGRDAAELALVRAVLERGVPFLGICRGLQVLNVARGGTLHQHLPGLVGHNEHAPQVGAYASHPVRVAPGSRLAGVLGESAQFPVPTYHHQAIDRLGGGLVACAWAADGVIEAVEFAPAEPDGPQPGQTGFALAVQWHPEASDDPRLFEALVAAASLLPAG